MAENERIKLEANNRLASSGLVNIIDSCDNCGCRPRYRENGTYRKWCSRCIAVYQRRQELLPEWAEQRILHLVGALYYRATLKDFNTTLPAIRGQIFTNRAGGDVFIFGPAGVGKTHLFAAAIRHLIYQGFECILIHFDDFLVQLRSTMSPRASLTEWEVIEPLKKIDYLFIDDLGLRTKVENDFPYVTLFSILNARQINCLPTWISSNKSIDGIGKSFDARITSRLQTSLVIPMSGPDKRSEHG